MQLKIIKYNMTQIKDSIKLLSILLLQESVIIASWGITNIAINKSNISFDVCGLKYTGKVYVQSMCDGKYEIQLECHTIGPCSLDNIVETLDLIIERTDNYQQHLEEWIMKHIKNSIKESHKV